MQLPPAGDMVFGYDEIGQRFGISKRTLWNWIQSAGITPMVDPNDTRRRVLRDSDVAKLAELFANRNQNVIGHEYQEFETMTSYSTQPLPPKPLSQVVPNADHRLAKRHHGTIDVVLENLAARDDSELVVCSGLRGTPISRVERVLADLFDVGNHFTYDSELALYKRLVKIDMRHARSRSETEAVQFLGDALDFTEANKQVLVVDALELLQEHTAVDKVLLRELGEVGRAAVLGIFTLSSESSRGPAEAFPNLKMRVVEIPNYTAKRTLNTIRSYFAEGWENQGFKLADDALDTLFAVQPGVYEQRKRKGLPYLATELIQESIRSVRSDADGRSTILEGLFRTAQDNLEMLLSPAGEGTRLLLAITPFLGHHVPAISAFAESALERYQKMEQAYQEIRTLVDSELPFGPIPGPTRSSPFILTRATVNAQFFGSNKYVLELAEAFNYWLHHDFPASIV